MTAEDRLAFVSYARKDSDFARPFAAYLRARGLRTWVDRENLRDGEAWEAAVENVLPSVTTYVACLSEASVKSPWTSIEHRRALGLGLVMVPILIGGLTADEAPDILRHLPAIDVSRHPREEAAFQAAFQIAAQAGAAPLDLTDLIARSIHERWRAELFSTERAARWKTLPARDDAWVRLNAAALGDRLEVSPSRSRIDLQRLSFHELPPSIAAEATEAARDIVLLLERSPPDGLEQCAEEVHLAWLRRNGETASPAQSAPYAQLDESEKEKDRIIVRTAALALGLSLPSA